MITCERGEEQTAKWALNKANVLHCFTHRKKSLISLGVFIIVVNCLLISENYPSFSLVVPKGSNQHVYYFDQNHYVNKSEKRILLWTRYFYDANWERSVKRVLNAPCSHKCSVTTDKSTIKEADAIVFHLLDLYIWERPPQYRAPHQVWVLHNNEPPPHQYYTGRSLVYSRFAFNWTLSYRRDSTIRCPYGRSWRKAKTAGEKHRYENFAEGKTKMTYGVISNCVDDAGRYSYVKRLREHTPLDLYGRCGNLTCPRNGSCEALLKPYRFAVTFENSNCKYYTSEKFWNALNRRNIPLVNWIPEQVPFDAPPKSYINVHEYQMEDLAKLLKRLANNDTEYNSYFEWRKNYTVIADHFAGFCDMCKALHNDSVPAQVVDYKSWLADDTCQGWTLTSIITRRIKNYFVWWEELHSIIL